MIGPAGVHVMLCSGALLVCAPHAFGAQHGTPWGRTVLEANTEARRRAVADLAQRMDDDARLTLEAAALLDVDAVVREEAVRVLGGRRDRDQMTVFEHALLERDARVRRASLDAIRDIGGDVAGKAVAVALFDPDPALRQEAVYALGRVGGVRAVREVRRALNDRHVLVRQAAAQILDELTTDEDGY